MSYVGKVTAGGATHLVGSTLYGTCSTAAATAAKVVTCANFDKLETGVTIHVKFTNSNAAANATLNVNSTGAKPLCMYGTTNVGTGTNASWEAGAVVSFTYDGASWVMNDYIANTDENVVQTLQPTSTAAHPLLFSAYATSDWSTTGQKKQAMSWVTKTLYFQPSTGNLAATKFNNYTLAAACAKGVDTSISAGSLSTNLPTTAAVASYVASQITGATAFQGSLGTTTSGADYTQDTLEASSYIKGWYWVVNAEGTYVGKLCGIGDMVYATEDKGASYSADDFTVVQNEMDSITNSEIDTIVAS